MTTATKIPTWKPRHGQVLTIPSNSCLASGWSIGQQWPAPVVSLGLPMP